MKQMIPLRIKLHVSFLRHAFFSKYRVTPSPLRRVYIFLAADYGNLGDVAITQAQHLFLQSRYPDAEIMEVPISKTLKYLKGIARSAKPEDIVTIVGGGNMGDLYDDIEFLRQLVVREFPHHVVFSFPQSVFFSETKSGINRLSKAQQVYNSHRKLTLMARDPVSYARMMIYFPSVSVGHYPDIVFSLDKRKHIERNRTVLFCLRKDKEQAVADIAHLPKLLDYIQRYYEDIRYADTQIDDLLVKENGGEKYLNQIWNSFSQSGLVVTDRLHGMIFAFITKTPALVFDNKTRKISSTYTWIKDCGFIHLVDEKTDFESLSFVDNYDMVKSKLNFLFDQML